MQMHSGGMGWTGDNVWMIGIVLIVLIVAVVAIVRMAKK